MSIESSTQTAKLEGALPQLRFELEPPDEVQLGEQFPWPIIVSGKQSDFEGYLLTLQLREAENNKITALGLEDFMTPLIIPNTIGPLLKNRCGDGFVDFWQPTMHAKGNFKLCVCAVPDKSEVGTKGIDVLSSKPFDVIVDTPEFSAEQIPKEGMNLAKELWKSDKFAIVPWLPEPEAPYLLCACHPDPEIERNVDFYPPPVVQVKNVFKNSYPDFVVKIEVVRPLDTKTLSGSGTEDSAPDARPLHKFAVFNLARLASNVALGSGYQLRASLYATSKSEEPILQADSYTFEVTDRHVSQSEPRTKHERGILQVLSDDAGFDFRRRGRGGGSEGAVRTARRGERE
ncbi:hypothetical protein F5X99DRAFT_406306 [Biscogniauxia marginata]|nr:hypothetical protein F5X99DRAFT_406306 [Biscogniauxia marginata]